MILGLEQSLQTFSENEVFFCPEESYFYSHCLEKFVLSTCLESELVVEFGCGDGSPVIYSLLRNSFVSKIHGYELNPDAANSAQTRIEQYKLGQKYFIYNESFFEAARPDAQYLIANPPYLPAIDDNIQMPLLRGGNDGSGITKQLLSLNYPTALMMISSYSNPVETIKYALKQNYYVADFLLSPLQFGYYSREPKVKQTIRQLKKSRRAFYSENIYFLAGVLFRKQHRTSVDLSAELLKIMTAI